MPPIGRPPTHPVIAVRADSHKGPHDCAHRLRLRILLQQRHQIGGQFATREFDLNAQ
jgi:hypothetical protein